jgi:hypothetical protein
MVFNPTFNNISVISCRSYNLALLRSRVRVRVFNLTFNNILIISWRSVLLVEETEVPGENH